MSARSLRNRLARAVGGGGECDQKPTAVYVWRPGRPEPDTSGAPPCKKCGVPHPLVLKLVIVETREQAMAAMEQVKNQPKYPWD